MVKLEKEYGWAIFWQNIFKIEWTIGWKSCWYWRMWPYRNKRNGSSYKLWISSFGARCGYIAAGYCCAISGRFPLHFVLTRVNSVFRLTEKKMENFNRFVLVNLKWLDVQLFQIPKFYAHQIRLGFIHMTLSTVKLPDTRFWKELREIIKWHDFTPTQIQILLHFQLLWAG